MTVDYLVRSARGLKSRIQLKIRAHSPTSPDGICQPLLHGNDKIDGRQGWFDRNFSSHWKGWNVEMRSSLPPYRAAPEDWLDPHNLGAEMCPIHFSKPYLLVYSEDKLSTSLWGYAKRELCWEVDIYVVLSCWTKHTKMNCCQIESVCCNVQVVGYPTPSRD